MIVISRWIDRLCQQWFRKKRHKTVVVMTLVLVLGVSSMFVSNFNVSSRLDEASHAVVAAVKDRATAGLVATTNTTNSNTTTTAASNQHVLASSRGAQSTNPQPQQPLLYNSNKHNETAALCGIVKHEEYYIDEWIDYHLAIGYSNIYIYDNTDDYEMKEWGDDQYRTTNGSVITVHYPGRGMQQQAYQDCAIRYDRVHVWMAYYDVDEFLWLKQHDTVVDFLQQHCRHGAVAINRVRMGYDGRQVYEPLPVTKRFLYAKELRHPSVKSIARIEDMNKNRPPHCHFPYLRDGATKLDTNGTIVPEMTNAMGPLDVAVITEYMTKSRKEYIDKRRRGRADKKGPQKGREPERLADAIAGKALSNGTIRQGFYEEFLKRCPKYAKVYENNMTTTLRSPARVTAGSNATAVCTITRNEEAYMDEWVDYHHALGFSHFYIYDASGPLGLQQWGQEKGPHVTVIPFGGEPWTVELKTQAYMDCAMNAQKEKEEEKNGQATSSHTWLAFFDVNEFLMLHQHTSIDRFLLGDQQQQQHVGGYHAKRFWQHWTRSLSASPSIIANTEPSVSNKTNVRGHCGIQAILTERFGTGGHGVYRPWPVTQRFLYRDQSTPSSVHLHEKGGARFILHLQDLQQNYLANSNNNDTQVWFSLFQRIATSSSIPMENTDDSLGGVFAEGCDTVVPAAQNVAVLYHYIKSRKECKLRMLNFNEIDDKEARLTDTDSCNVTGTVRDTSGWEMVKKFTPNLAPFDDFVNHF